MSDAADQESEDKNGDEGTHLSIIADANGDQACEGVLSRFDDNEGDVVLLRHGRRLPIPNLREQLVRQVGPRARLIVANSLFKPEVAEGIASGILRFSYSICAKQEVSVLVLRLMDLAKARGRGQAFTRSVNAARTVRAKVAYWTRAAPLLLEDEVRNSY